MKPEHDELKLAVHGVDLPDPEPAAAGARKLALAREALLKDIAVDLKVFVGEAKITLQELFDLKEGAVLPLQRALTHPADVELNGKVVARAEVVAVGQHYGVRITEILPAQADGA
ncbi:FliM/FliN family flagellar motor switch protein [Cupriavidus basilensis]|uniref:Flagellar motor switch protein FliN n=1 Tax=Cupriavidus basilensis TaxID=68895 RepID=A0ABT6AW16_9BURK|nr:FliM/FliN family flagellar motor switch protein [Cupriavidus basilensis]MDF3836820.1 FliM/FliN family flagellar motor switch protein [Cupriavidus basilensis]